MNNLMKFDFKGNNVRTIVKDGEAWFIAKDICDVLEIKNTTDALKRLDEDERSRFNLGRQGETNIINEFGLYNLIIRSDKPEAKQFRRWVTHEVLPSIRKHGIYATDNTIENMINNPDFTIELLTKLKEERAEKLEEQRKKELIKSVAIELKNENKQLVKYNETLQDVTELLEKENCQLDEIIEAQKPSVEFTNAVSNSNTCISVGTLSKLLNQNGIDVGQNRLYAWMREHNYLISRKGVDYNTPTQRAMTMNIFKVKEKIIHNEFKPDQITKTTYVTGKGQKFFINKFLQSK